MVVSIDGEKRRIALALAPEEQAETQAYLREATKKGDGFGLTLGERLNQARRT